MKLNHCVLITFAVLLIGCGSRHEGPGDTPEATFESMKAAAIAKDGPALLKLFTPKGQEKVEKRLEASRKLPDGILAPQAEKVGMSVEEYRKASWKEIFVRAFENYVAKGKNIDDARNAKIMSSHPNGDHAQVTVRMGGDDQDVPMVRVDGKWYLEVPE